MVVDAPCTVALRTVHGRVRGKNGWMDCKEPKPGMYSGAAWAAARVTGNGLVRIQPEQAIRIAEAIDESIDQSAPRR